MELVAKNLNDLKKVALQIFELSSDRKIILFNGEMGVGKTTLIKELAKCYGIEDNVSSPTYSIVNEYKGREVVYHFDFYRLKDEEEAYDFGVEEYFESGNICLLEWPEKISNLLPLESECLSINITLDEGVRKYNF